MNSITDDFINSFMSEKQPASNSKTLTKVADELTYPEALAIVLKNKSKLCLGRITKVDPNGLSRKYILLTQSGLKYFLSSFINSSIEWYPSEEELLADDWAIFKLPKNK